MYRSRAKVDPYGTDCGVSSVSALHALFSWATGGSTLGRVAAWKFPSLEEEDWHSGLSEGERRW
jgi:hypothetical protein